MSIDLAEFEEDVRAWVLRRDDTLALIRLARAALKCHPDTFVSTPDEVAEYIEAASAFTDSAEAKS